MAVRPVATSLDRFGAAQAYGCMSRAHSGHHVVLVDGDGTPVPTDEPGEIETQTDAPTRCLGYLNAPEKDAGTGLGAWLRTHDLAMQDTDGYFWSSGRADDLIKSPGFRIGPAEIADCLIAHPAVAECPVEGKPDADRGGGIVAAFVSVSAGVEASDALKAEPAAHVRTRLAGFKAPRDVAFMAEFVLTSSGKINRRLLREAELTRAAAP